jgi:signal transduction histidine kinase
MEKSTRIRTEFIPVSTVRSGLAGLAFFFLSFTAPADVRITEVVVDNQPRDLRASSAYPASQTQPLRLSASSRSVSFHFTESNPQGAPSVRLRYKLEGSDETWRDLPAQMRVMVQFQDAESRSVGGTEFPMQGESPGWRGTVETSDFYLRRERVTVPPRAAKAHIYFLSHGGESGICQIAIDPLRVLLESPGAQTPRVLDLRITGGSNLSDPMGSPANWRRDASSRPELARLAIRPIPAPHPVLVLDDDDPLNFANWSGIPRQDINVSPGELLTLEWETAHSIGKSGPGHAEYGRINPGRYWFRVAAARPNGELTGLEVSLPVVVVAPWHRRPEYWSILLASVAAAGFGGHQILIRRRMRKRLAALESERALERERARIARDLHDDIGAGLSEIAMQGDWVRRDLARGPTADTQRRIERICQSAVELTRGVDEIVWALNPANDTVQCFANYVAQTTEQFLDAAGQRVRFDIPRGLPATELPGKIRHSVFLAVREALNNAAKHAHADLVRLGIQIDGATLRVTVEDNGRGFAPENPGPLGTHEGLDTMRRRMDLAGGEFRLTSRPGAGTRAEFVVPLPG